MNRLSVLPLLVLFLACAAPEQGPVPENGSETEQKRMEITLHAGGKTFAADLEDSETGRAFAALLPMTLEMSELNGNEKYRYLDAPLPTKARHYDRIDAGDLMLYGNNCVVLFYGTAGGYSYTRIGRLRQTEGLADALGKGGVTVSFE